MRKLEQSHACRTSLTTKSIVTRAYRTIVTKEVRLALKLSKGDKIQWQVCGGGVLLRRAEPRGDPIIAEFLRCLAQDIKTHPEKAQALPRPLVSQIRGLVAGVEFDLNEPLPRKD